MLSFWLRRLSPVAFDAFMFALTMLKFRQSRREELRRPILNTMVRDGTWAFILTLGESPAITMFLGAHALTGRAVVMVLNAVIYTVFSETLSGIFYLYVCAFVKCQRRD